VEKEEDEEAKAQEEEDEGTLQVDFGMLRDTAAEIIFCCDIDSRVLSIDDPF